MLPPNPWYRSVWVDVFGVVAILALLVAPLLYLAAEVGSGSSIAGGGTRQLGSPSHRSVSPRAHAGGRSGFSQWRQRRRSQASRLFSSSPVTERTSSASAVPFASSWRNSAVPNLSAGAPTSPSSGGTVTSNALPSSSPRTTYQGGSQSSIPSRRFSSAKSNQKTVAAARQFASRARALSNQLGQMTQDPVARSLGPTAAPSTETGGLQASSGGGSATASATAPPLPEDDPQNVPIDDHLHWLLAAGALWGIWRITRG